MEDTTDVASLPVARVNHLPPVVENLPNTPYGLKSSLQPGTPLILAGAVYFLDCTARR